MNTPQLVILWYAGLLIAFLAFVKGFDRGMELWVITGIILLSGLLIYTLGSHPKANKKAVFAWILLPLSLMVFGIAGFKWLEDYQYQMKKKERVYQQAMKDKKILQMNEREISQFVQQMSKPPVFSYSLFDEQKFKYLEPEIQWGVILWLLKNDDEFQNLSPNDQKLIRKDIRVEAGLD